MSHTDLPLFNWKPPVSFIAFPLDRRVGKIRDVASKLLTKTTDRHADHYCSQVTEGLRTHLSRIGIDEQQQEIQITAFWGKVDIELARMSYRGAGSNDPRGAA